MSESTRKKIITGVLVLAIIWGYNNLMPSSTPSKQTKNRAQAVVEVEKPVAESPATPKLVKIEQKVKEPWGTDPFRVERQLRRTDKATQKNLKWHLSGILYNSLSPIAIINKKQVRPGDIVNSAKVLSIDKKAVTLEYNGNRMTITVTKG